MKTTQRLFLSTEYDAAGLATILNLGCGTRTSERAINVDWSLYARAYASRAGRLLAPLILSGERLDNFRAMNGKVIVHDLRKGLPFASSSIDAVYHSHVLEHIDRARVPTFFSEILRVLRPGGIHRIVVPDWESQVREYLVSLDVGGADHDKFVARLLELHVLREAAGTSLQPSLRRRIENVVLGDARRRGHTHQWAYDQLNLRQILESLGFVDFRVVGPRESRIPDWDQTLLDIQPDGSVYKPGSLWAEAEKPK